MTEKRRLVREPGTARPRRGRLHRMDPHDREERGHDRDADDGDGGRVHARRGRRGRPPLYDEVQDINRGIAFVGVESAAIAMDVLSRVLRGAVDRAFDEDYENPGDIVRGFAGEADLAVYDLVGELRHVPRRLSHRFDDAVRSPRADVGERKRREDEGASTPKDSPASRNTPSNGK
jgi:hypothetical protein